jgi:hypothetical protein
MSNVFIQASQQAMQVLEMARKYASQQQLQDPNMAIVQVEAQEVQRKAKADEMQAMLKMQELQNKIQLAAKDSQRKDQQLQDEMALAQAELMQSQAKAASDREMAQLQAERAWGEQQLDAARVAQDQALVEQGRQKLQQDYELAILKERVRKAMNDADNATAFRIAIMKMANDLGSKSNVSTGIGINKNPQPR